MVYRWNRRVNDLQREQNKLNEEVLSLQNKLSVLQKEVLILEKCISVDRGKGILRKYSSKKKALRRLRLKVNRLQKRMNMLDCSIIQELSSLWLR